METTKKASPLCLVGVSIDLFSGVVLLQRKSMA